MINISRSMQGIASETSFLAMTGLKYIMPHVVLNRAHAASSTISAATSLPRHCEESAGRRGNLIHEKAATT